MGVPSRCFRRGRDRAKGSVWCSRRACGREGREGRKIHSESNLKSGPEPDRRYEGGREGGREGEKDTNKVTHLPKDASGEVVVLKRQAPVPDGGHRAGVDGVGAMLLHKEAQGGVGQGLGGREGGREGRKVRSIWVSDGHVSSSIHPPFSPSPLPSLPPLVLTCVTSTNHSLSNPPASTPGSFKN